MDSNDFLKNLKIIVIIAVIIAVIGAFLYLLYGLALVWQAIAAGIVSGLLFLLLIVFVVISLYLWTRNYLLKRDLARSQAELHYCRAELAKYERGPDNKNKKE